MKTILLIRHAKSGWESFQKDIERNLTGSGRADAAKMAGYLLSKEIKIDLFVSSPAERAMQTAAIFSEIYRGLRPVVFEQLYEPEMDDFVSTIQSLDDQYDSAAVFTHNPGITDFANSVTTVRINNMPECGIFCIESAIDEWKDFSAEKSRFLFFASPETIGR